MDIRNQHPNFKIDWTPASKAHHAKATRCENCHVTFNHQTRKVAHHYHYIAKDNYANALCNKCNLKFQERVKKLVVLVHNLSYDLSLILKQASPNFDFKLNKRRGFHYYSGDTMDLKFYDSMNMLKGSLASLAKEHIKNSGDLTYTKASLSHLSPEAQALLLESGKQVFPYEFLDNFDKLQNTSLPPKEAFYSTLTDSHISQEDYDHAKKVWDLTNCQTLLDYVKLYLNMDVSLLADVYLQWRDTLMSLFDLDCLYYLTLASYAFEAFLYKTQTQLDCISDENLYQLITRNVRGGFCSVGKRHVKAENKDTVPNFPPGQLGTYLLYIDFNSLYPTCMSQNKLPQGDFKELKGAELEQFLKQDLRQIDTRGDIGYYLHIDSHPISPDVAVKTDAFPLCISKLNITQDDLSPYSRHLLESSHTKLPSSNAKLVAHHLGVKDYLVSLPLLQFLIEKGLVVDKVHRVYQFKQGDYLKAFIDQNITKRAQETNPFIKNALKLINNSIYGRMLLNQLNYSTDTKVCTQDIQLVRSFSKPNFRNVNFISDQRALVTYQKAGVSVDSPIFVGFSILEHAKLMMYKFWYDVLLKTYGDRVGFVYSDTDSFVISLKTDDLNREIRGPLAPYLDLSNLPPNHPLYDNSCKGHLGKLKIETGADFMTEFVALRPKMYSYITTGSPRSHNTLKGVAKHRREGFTFQEYLACLEHNQRIPTEVSRLQFRNKEMALITQRKLALSSFEDKRYYIDAYHSVGYGHPACRENGTTTDNGNFHECI